MLCGEEVFALGALAVYAGTGHQAEALEHLVLYIEVVRKVHVLVGIAGADESVVHGIDHRAAVGILDAIGAGEGRKEDFLKVPVFVVRGKIGVEAGVGRETSVGRVLVVHEGNAHDVAEGPFPKAVGKVYITGNVAAVRALHGTVHLVIAKGCQRLEVFASQFYGKGMLVANARAKRFGEPVGVFSFHCLLKTGVV